MRARPDERAISHDEMLISHTRVETTFNLLGRAHAQQLSSTVEEF